MIVGEQPIPERQSPVTKEADTSPAPLRTSVRQVEANRRNALHSTGPTTPEGKQASRLNALTHGLRAKEVIIPGQEDPAEFEVILRELYEDWEPDGHTEVHLLDQIGLAEWRLRRARRTELGEIRRQMARSAASDFEAELDDACDHFPERVPELVVKSTAGIPYLQCVVQNTLDELDHKGKVSEKQCDDLGFHFSKMPYNPAEELRIWFLGEIPEEEDEYEQDLDSDDEPAPAADKDEADKKAAAREYLETVLKDLDGRERKLRKQERTDLEIARQRLSITKGPELERIQRYETTIKRDMYRAIDQLERLQRRRRGEPPPPTVNVNVSNDD